MTRLTKPATIAGRRLGKVTHMAFSMSGVTARIDAIQQRIDTLSGAAPQAIIDSESAAPMRVPGSFATALAGATGSPPDAPPLPALFAGSGAIAPDGSSVRPLNPAEMSGASSRVMSYAPQIGAAAAKYGVDPKIVSAVMQVESGGNPDAVSSVGAQGLMQLMPSTARAAGVDNSFDPAQNIDGGAKEIASLLSEFGGNLDLALAGYNAGRGAVKRFGGVPPYPETQAYVRKVRGLIGNS